MGVITENIQAILAHIPSHVQVVAAAKSRTAEEIREAVAAGITIIGENYFQDARAAMEQISAPCQWHFIGHVQKNKVKHVVPLFDMIETVDSFELAQMIDSQALKHGKRMPVLIEVNSACEPQKAGALPELVPDLMRRLSMLPNLRIQGLMTMGPFLDEPEGLRPYFRLTRQIFERVAAEQIPEVDMRYLSMGMSDSFRIAIEEGANLVRIGTRIFGPRF